MTSLPTIWKRIESWVQTRRAERERDAFEKGYGWAMTQRYLNHTPLEFVEDMTYGGGNPSPSKFDEGAREALRYMDAAQTHAEKRRKELKRLGSLLVPPGGLHVQRRGIRPEKSDA